MRGIHEDGNKKGREKGKVYSHFRRNIAGTDAVYLDIVLAPLIAERLCHLAQSAFGRGICWDGEATLEREKGAEIDDFTAMEGNHVSAGCLREEPNRLEVNVDYLE